MKTVSVHPFYSISQTGGLELISFHVLGPVLQRVDINRNLFAIDINRNYVYRRLQLAIDLDQSQLFISRDPIFAFMNNVTNSEFSENND